MRQPAENKQCTATNGSLEVRGRFAPSPTGRMHAGNIFAYLCSWLVAKSQNGSIVLRIEDLDKSRSKDCYAQMLMRDLEKLGLLWDEGPYYQSTRDASYEAALAMLNNVTEIYPCFCTRADLHASSAPHAGDRFVYAGTCRHLSAHEREARTQEGRVPALRMVVPSEEIRFIDALQGEFAQNLQNECGDFVVKRSEGSFAYQLAVVVDDAAQGVNNVVRGVDLLSSTPQQIHLQRILGLPEPSYCHIPLLVASDGRRLAKRDKDASLDMLLERFRYPEAILGYIAGIAGLTDTCEPASALDILSAFDLEKWKAAMTGIRTIEWR